MIPATMPNFRCGFDHRLRDVSQPFVTAECAVVLVLEGRLILDRSDGSRYNAQAGEAVKRFPSEVHTLHFKASTTYAYLAVPASTVPMLAAAGVPALDEPILRPCKGPWRDRWQMLSERLAQGSGRASLEVRLDLVHLFADLHLSHAMADPDEEALLKAKVLLEREQALTIPEIGRRCGLSYSVFRDLFRQRFGMSPLAWQRSRRLERAMHLLLETDLSIAEVAERCGYGQASRLSQQFRAVHACAPRDWRIRHGRWLSTRPD